MADLTMSLDEAKALPSFETDWKLNTPYVFQGLTIVIEYLAGDTRTKVKDTGVTVSGVMPTAYGFILRTNDIHGEEIDMYLAAMPDHDASIYVIDQVNPSDHVFDEHKVMLGFGSIDEVVHNYTQVFADGSGESRIGAITTFTVDQFVEWINLDGSAIQPATANCVDGVPSAIFTGVKPPPRQTTPESPKIDETGGVVVTLPDLKDGNKLYTKSSEVGSFDYTMYLLSPLNMLEWSSTVDAFCRTLDLASDKDTVHVHLSSPGGMVLLLGRILSAMDATKAKVITYADGEVASAATSIWAAGHERHINPGAYFMQHMSSQMLDGKTPDIVAKSQFCLEYIKHRLNYLEHIGLYTAEEVADMIEKSADVFITAKEAISRVGAVSYKGDAS